MTKTCRGCLEKLSLDDFGIDRATRDGRTTRCRPCRRAESAAYRSANVEKVRAAVRRWAAKNSEKRRAYQQRVAEHRREYNREWQRRNSARCRQKARDYRQRHPDRVAACVRRYRQENPERVREMKRKWNRENNDKVRAHGVKRRADPKYRIEASFRARLHQTLTRGSKNAPMFALLAYSSHELRARIASQFLPGMSWENYGDWHIDHIVPLSAFRYSTPGDPDFRRAWALTNLQPLWAQDNFRKHARIIPELTGRVA